MDNRYELYCLVDPLYHDSPVIDGAPEFVHATRHAPGGRTHTVQAGRAVLAYLALHEEPVSLPFLQAPRAEEGAGAD